MVASESLAQWKTRQRLTRSSPEYYMETIRANPPMPGSCTLGRAWGDREAKALLNILGHGARDGGAWSGHHFAAAWLKMISTFGNATEGRRCPYHR